MVAEVAVESGQVKPGFLSQLQYFFLKGTEHRDLKWGIWWKIYIWIFELEKLERKKNKCPKFFRG